MTILELNYKIEKLQLSIDRLKKQAASLEKQETVNRKVRQITDEVEFQYGLPKGSVYKKTKKRAIVEPRQMSMLLITLTTGLGIEKVGELFEVDHSTVSHAKKSMANFFETNTVILNNFKEVCHRLNINEVFINQMIAKTISYGKGTT